MYIDSAGGSVSQSLNVISTMNGIQTPVVTFCRGVVGGPAAVIAAHGLKGFRIAEPGTQFSLNLQNDSSRNGHSHHHESYLKLLVQIFAADTAKPEPEILRWLAEGAQFSAKEAMQNGLIDSIAGEPLLPEGS